MTGRISLLEAYCERPYRNIFVALIAYGATHHNSHKVKRRPSFFVRFVMGGTHLFIAQEAGESLRVYPIRRSDAVPGSGVG